MPVHMSLKLDTHLMLDVARLPHMYLSLRQSLKLFVTLGAAQSNLAMGPDVFVQLGCVLECLLAPVTHRVILFAVS
jgi:hypothetical protein